MSCRIQPQSFTAKLPRFENGIANHLPSQSAAAVCLGYGKSVQIGIGLVIPFTPILSITEL
ncbi:hypothetical protein D3C75_1383410 [compost metagenome]